MKPRFAMVAVVAALGLGMAFQAEAQTTWNSVTLSWTTPGDDSLTGTASQFDVRYSTSLITEANYALATRFAGTPTPTAPGSSQSVVVTGLSPGTTYYFALKTGDDVPNWAIISNVVNKTTLLAPDVTRPLAIANVSVASVTDSSALLSWSATGDDSLTGTAASYDIRYSTAPITAANFAAATQSTGEPVPTAAGTTQTFNVRGLSRQATYYFAVRATDDAGNPSALSNVPSATTPDTMAPGRVTNLAAGFVWFAWHSTIGHDRALAKARR
ncbi:MAG: fibronectin type III domain-containing protein [Candidatus Eisenbacteria bacterium]